jgi:hypothetical protein
MPGKRGDELLKGRGLKKYNEHLQTLSTTSAKD